MSAHEASHPLGALRAFLTARRADAPGIRGLVLAHSGGPDSLTLLLAAAQIAPLLGYRLRALHVHHGLHADADAWAAQAMAQATAVSVPCDVLRVRVPAGASIEATARAARYDALTAGLATDEALLLAHHLDDQAETLLLRLMRGAGLHGLAGMRPVSAWRAPDGRETARWRPWLSLPREALARWRPRAEACLRSHDPLMPACALDPVQDPANSDPRFDRTLLRHELLPLLSRRWPEAAGQLARSARQLAGQAQALDALADDWLARAVLPSGALSLPLLTGLDDVTLQAVVSRWLSVRGAPSLPVRYWSRLRAELLRARADSLPQLAWAGWSLRRYREAVYLLADASLQALPAGGADWPDPRVPLQWAGREWLAAELVPGLAEDDPRLVLPWRLAPRRGGERWRPPGKAHSVSVKHWCQEMGIPPWERGRVVCLWVGEAVLAVVPVSTGDAGLAASPAP